MKKINLKYFVLSAMMLMSYSSVKAIEPEDTTGLWRIRLLGPDEPIPDDPGNGNHKAPVHLITPPSIVYNTQTEELVFTGEATQAKRGGG